jgi:hypothetical protein
MKKCECGRQLCGWWDHSAGKSQACPTCHDIGYVTHRNATTGEVEKEPCYQEEFNFDS